MADAEYRRLLDTASDRAFFGFLALVQRAIQDADKNIVTLLSEAKSKSEQAALTSLRHFLRQDGNVFLRRIDTLLRSSLERAMQTIYVDLRAGMRKLSANELSLINDEVVTHQIEVGRLTQRMRDACEETIGRLNVIVAHMHGQSDAKERENPFRPYLLARALYDATRETVTDEAQAKLLFEQLASALIPHLPGYYDAIRQVFEASGIRGKFIAQQSRTACFQRYFGAPLVEQHNAFSARVLPGLQRMLETMQFAPNTGAADAAGTMHGFIRSMLSPSRGVQLPGAAAGKGRMTANPLAAQLDGYQKKVAKGEAIDEQVPQQGNQLFALRERMTLDQASTAERMTVEVIAMLFEFILDDEQIPAELRVLIGRLQIPILKAALLDPSLLHEEAHPARQLLNRMSSAALASDPGTQEGQQLGGEIARIVNRILEEFGNDVSIFAASLEEFERFLAKHLRRDNSQIPQAIEAVEIAEKISILLTRTTTELCNVLLPMNADKRISDLIIQVWPHVLVRAAWEDMERKISPLQPDSMFQMYRAVLPDLLWSIQDKPDPNERTALMRMLPELVKRLTGALQLIQLPDDERQEILDQLVAMHMQVLRGARKATDKALPTLDKLRQDFMRVAINWDRISWELAEPPQPRGDLIEEVLARRRVSCSLNLGINTMAAAPSDREFLTQTYLLGTKVEIRSADDAGNTAQLVWISSHRSLYLFRQDDGALAIYSCAALLEALREGMISPVEYAPVFERAVETLLFGAEKVQAGAF